MSKPPAHPEPELFRAARIGDHEALAHLLAASAEVNSRADLEVDNGPHLRQLTPLMVAARSIDGATVETLRLLLAHGADLRAVSEGGETAAWYAAGKGGRWPFHDWRLCDDHVDRLRLLLDAGLDPHECSFNGRSLMTEACEAGDPARVRLLLERGVPANATFDLAENARQNAALAAEFGLSQLPEDLREICGDVPWLDREFEKQHFRSSQILLFCAASSGSSACVRLLVESGADVDVRDDRGSTALMHARSAEVVAALLAAGIERDAVNRWGEDALQAAWAGDCVFGCDRGRFDAADALLRAGADISRVNDDDPRLRVARLAFRRNAEAVEFLVKRGADPAGALHAVCWQGESSEDGWNRNCERIIETLVEAGADLNAADERGVTPLHEAASGDWGSATAIRTLLRLGAAPDPVLPSGVTPLTLAASSGEVECVRLLLAAGADPRRKDRNGKSAQKFAEEHLATWREIARTPAEPVGPWDSAEAAASRTAAALAKAEETLRLVRAS